MTAEDGRTAADGRIPDDAAPCRAPCHAAAGQSAPSLAQSVLIVDDEDGVRDLMSRWLGSAGYLVTMASNAEEALGRLDMTPSAVALCDIRMPGRDGLSDGTRRLAASSSPMCPF